MSDVFATRRGAGLAALVLPIALLAGAPATQAADWEWQITPYFFAADVGVDVSLNDTDIASTTVDFSDILDKLDLGALVHFEGRKGGGGFFVDVVYMSLSDDTTTSGAGPIPAGTRVDGEMDQLIGEAGGFYRLTGDEQGLDLLFGARVLDVGLDVSLDFPATSLIADRTRSGDSTLLDGFVGLRFSSDISNRWIWSIRGDVGGGDTDLTWQGILNFGFKLGKDLDNVLFVGYRHLAYEFEEGNNGITEREIEFTGPTVGFKFSF